MTCFPRRIAGLLAVAALAITAAGCGGADTTATDAYVSQVNSIQAQLVSTYQRLASEVTASSPSSDDAATFEKLQSVLGLTVTRLRAVKVPDEVRGQHAELASALEAYQADLAGATEALTSDSSSRVAKARAALERQTATLGDVFARKISEINAQLRD